MRSVRDELDNIPRFGDIAGAVRVGQRAQSRRRRLRTSIAVVAAAAVVAAVASVGLVLDRQTPLSRGDAAPAGPTTGTDLGQIAEVSDAITAWIPRTDLVGRPAPGGTAIARSCFEPELCTWTLVTAKGTKIPVRDVSPVLDEILSGVEPKQVALSYDATWMTIDTGSSVRIQSLDPTNSRSAPILLEPQTDDRSWDLVSWGSGSISASFVESDASGLPTRYATVDLPNLSTSVVPAPRPQEFGPVQDYGVGVQVARRTRPGSYVSEIDTFVVGTRDDEALKNGEVTQISDAPEDLDSVLGAAETLSGPNGLVEVRTPPTRRDDEVGWPIVTVFLRSSEGLQRSGLIQAVRGAPVRIPSPDAEAGWVVLGTNVYGSIVQEKLTGESSRIRGVAGQDVLWTQASDTEAEWIVPGVVIR